MFKELYKFQEKNVRLSCGCKFQLLPILLERFTYIEYPNSICFYSDRYDETICRFYKDDVKSVNTYEDEENLSMVVDFIDDSFVLLGLLSE